MEENVQLLTHQIEPFCFHTYYVGISCFNNNVDFNFICFNVTMTLFFFENLNCLFILALIFI